MTIAGTIFFLLIFLIPLVLVGILILVPAIIAGILYIIGEKFLNAPLWWKIFTVLIGIVSSIILAVHIFSEENKISPIPFLIIGVYALISFIFLNIRLHWKKKIKYNAEQTKKEYGNTVNGKFPAQNNYNKPMNSGSAYSSDPFLHYEKNYEPNLDIESDIFIDDDELQAKMLCEKLKKAITIETTFWDEAHLVFKCNLVASYPYLHLNYEIKNTSGVPWYDGDGWVTLKVNVYDAEENLLCVEEAFIEDKKIARNRFSDFIQIDCDDIKGAVSMEIYAYQEE